MMMAQRYPWDFDGIIAAAPSMAYGNEVLGNFWLGEQLRDQSRAGLDFIALQTLHKAVLAQCDKLDGKVDGILDDPRQCRVDFRPVRCKGVANDECLTDRQVAIAQRIYEGPRRADGSPIASSTVMPGAELALMRVGSTFASIDGKPFWYVREYAASMLRNLAFDPSPGPGWQPDPSKLEDYAKRMSLMNSLFSAMDPDLTGFKNRGGKLLMYMGWNDPIGGVRTPIEYYEKAERVLGGRKNARNVVRLFMIPGMDHCAGGDGASNFDWLGELDKWVETGKGPDSVTGYHSNPDGSPKFYRTIRAYSSQPLH